MLLNQAQLKVVWVEMAFIFLNSLILLSQPDLLGLEYMLVEAVVLDLVVLDLLIDLLMVLLVMVLHSVLILEMEDMQDLLMEVLLVLS
jgi:hypothetical protein